MLKTGRGSRRPSGGSAAAAGTRCSERSRLNGPRGGRGPFELV